MLNPGFKNNLHKMTVGGEAVQVVTDRNIDLNEDGVKEQASVASVAQTANRHVDIYTDPAGASRTVIKDVFAGPFTDSGNITETV